METPKIKCTDNYKLFKFHEQNRKAGSNKGIVTSIENIDLTPFVPIIVDKDFFIIDGQNRFIACQKLGKPIYYVVMPDSYSTNDAIIALNRDQRAWNQNEFLHFHATTKGGCYRSLEDFTNEYKLSVSNANVIYPAKAINARTLRCGTLDFKKNPLADDIAIFLRCDEVKALRFGNTRPFVLAIRKAFEKYTLKELNKLKKKLIVVSMCANYEQYLIAFDNLIKR